MKKTLNKEKIKLLCMDLVMLVVLVLIDYYTKYLAVIKLKNQAAFNIIDGVLEFNYLENRGAAFGMLQNQKIFFVFIAVIFLSVIIFVLLRTPDDRKYRKLHILLTMIAAGAIGNMIDRLRFDYVVDFIYVSLIDFPIFNLADIYVVCGGIALVILVLFHYRDEDFDFIKK